MSSFNNVLILSVVHNQSSSNQRLKCFLHQSDDLYTDCLNAGSDIVFVLDASGSIGADNFLKVKQFVKDVISAFDIGFDKTRVGIVVYSSSNQVTRPFDLANYDNKTQMLAAVDRIVYTTGSTRTDLGLDMMTNVSFTPQRGARPVTDVNTTLYIHVKLTRLLCRFLSTKLSAPVLLLINI